MNTESKLTKEIKKWTSKFDDAIPTAKVRTEQGKKMFLNIKAYREDSQHFLEKGDLIKSFECLIWAWAIFEIGKELKHIQN